MQWDSSSNAGFTLGLPWMSTNPNYEVINAAAQVDDRQSVFNCWKSVLSARKQHKDIFVYGNFQLIDERNEKIFAYSRKSADGRIALVLCNFSSETVTFGDFNATVAEVLLSTADRTLDDLEQGSISLSPYEAVAVILS